MAKWDTWGLGDLAEKKEEPEEPTVLFLACYPTFITPACSCIQEHPHILAHHLQPFSSAPDCLLADIWPWLCHANTIQLTDSHMESVFWKPKSSLALNQHAHTQADRGAQFILHIHTHQQCPSNTLVLHILSALSRVSGVCLCVCPMCVCVWCQSHIREVFIMVPESTSGTWQGFLITWIRGCDRNLSLWYLVNAFLFVLTTLL